MGHEALLQQAADLYGGKWMSTNMFRMALSIREAAAALGVGRSMVYVLIGSGEICPIKIGRRTVIPIESINSFMGRKNKEAQKEQW